LVGSSSPSLEAVKRFKGVNQIAGEYDVHLRAPPTLSVTIFETNDWRQAYSMVLSRPKLV